MALSSEEAAKLQQKLQEIERLSRLLGANINTINLQDLERQSGNIEFIFERLTKQAAGLGEETDYLVSNFQKLVGEIKKTSVGVNESTKGLRALSSITEKISSYQKGYNNLSSKEISELKDKVKIETDRLKIAKNTLKEEAIELSQKIRYGNLTPKQLQVEQEKLAKIIIARKNIRQLLENEDITLGELNNKLDIAEKEAKRIEKALGLTGAALKGISKIPILGELIDTKEALEAAEKAAKDGAGRLGTMGAALGSMFKSLASNLTDPVTLIGLAVKGFQKLVEIGFKADTQVTNLAKSMAISKDQATAVRDRFVEIQNSGENVFETTENLVKAQLELADAFGATQGFTERQVRDQVYLTKQIGLSADEAAGLQQLAMANGKTAKEVNSSIIKQTASLAKQTGIQLDNKKILGEVAKVSGQLRLQYQNNPELIAKAVVQTQKLGISLDQASRSAKNLLNFEESIENQIAAELLTGKQLNLERARLLALNGDVAGSMQEMLSQVGGVAEFSSMNVIQQEALAKAVGMTADELANSLIQQENLNRLGSETKKQIQAQAEELRKKGMVEEANRLMNSIGNEEEALAALEEIAAQEKFNAAVEKLQAVLASIVEGPAMKLVDIIANVAADSTKLLNIFDGIKLIVAGLAGLKLTSLITQLAAAAVQAGIMGAGAATAASAVSFGVAAIAIVAGLATIMGAFDSAKSEVEAAAAVKDGEISSNGLIVGKYNKGQIQPIAQGSPDDNVIFTTNKISNNTNTTDNSELAREMREIKTILRDTLNIDKQMAANSMARQAASIVMDSTVLGTAINMGTYSVQ
jgi:hypothetical protein